MGYVKHSRATSMTNSHTLSLTATHTAAARLHCVCAVAAAERTAPPRLVHWAHTCPSSSSRH